MGIKDVVHHISEACIEACRNVGRTAGTLPTCFKGDHALSADPGTRDEIDQEVITEQESIGKKINEKVISEQESIEEVITEQESTGEEIIEDETPAKSAADVAETCCSQALTTRGERLELLRSQCSSELEYNVKKSTEHWTEVPHESSVDPTLFSANSEKFKRLMEHWRCPKSEHGFFLDYGELLKMGPKIAEGGQAEIFDAGFEGDPRCFVLKVFKDARLEDLERLWPPPLLPLLYVDYEPDWMREDQHCCWIRGGTVLKDGRFAFLMDKYDGDLRSFIDRRMQQQIDGNGPFELGTAVQIMGAIAKGMQSLHRRGILHRDLKASNVLMGDRLVVADFETSVGILGTGFWRAPEVLRALKTRSFKPEIWTEKADVYSYAMTCYEIMTGHIPFEGLRQNDYDFVLNGGRPRVPCWYWSWGYPPRCRDVYRNSNPVAEMRYPVPWLDNLLERCWHPDPLKRPSFKEIVVTLGGGNMYFKKLKGEGDC